jgi:8-amino-7-oxononanoate synthase
VDRQLESELRAELEQLAADGRKRSLKALASSEAIVDFTSNDYLGLARHPVLLEAAAQAIHQFGSGARASRSLGGGSPLDARAEIEVADWLGAESALLFPSGYQANLGLVTTLARRGDVLFSDELVHASLVDACRLSRACKRVFKHNDLAQLEELLSTHPGPRRRIVLTEGIFSMGGDRAPLGHLQSLCARYDAWLIVDEAHAVGILGPDGAGAWSELGDDHEGDSRLLARTVTGGKALGAAGGLIAGSTELREILLQSARSFIFTTGVPPAVSGALVAGVQLARDARDERAKLLSLGEHLARRLDLPCPAAAITPFVLGGNNRSVELSNRLRESGLEVRAVRPPTVPKQQAGLRMVLHSFNEVAEIDRMCDVLVNTTRPEISSPTVVAPTRPIFVAGTDTGIGKTVVSAVLLRSLTRDGPATYWKPVQTGDDSDTETVRLLSTGSGAQLGEPLYSFPLPASPHEAAADAGASICGKSLDRQLSAELDKAGEGKLVVELAGGLLVPYSYQRTQLDWLAERHPRIVLVARSGLGTLNHTLLSVEALRSRYLEVEALFLVGNTHPSNRETLERLTGISMILELPTFDTLDPGTIDSWIDGQGELPN